MSKMQSWMCFIIQAIIKYESQSRFTLPKNTWNLHKFNLEMYIWVVQRFTIVLFRQTWTQQFSIFQNKNMDITPFIFRENVHSGAWYIQTFSVKTFRRTFQTWYPNSLLHETLVEFDGKLWQCRKGWTRADWGSSLLFEHTGQTVNSYIHQNPRIWLRSVLVDLGIVYSIIWDIMKELVHGFAYKKAKVHQLQPRFYAQRVSLFQSCIKECGPIMISQLGQFFSDDWPFHVSELANI